MLMVDMFLLGIHVDSICWVSGFLMVDLFHCIHVYILMVDLFLLGIHVEGRLVSVYTC